MRWFTKNYCRAGENMFDVLVLRSDQRVPPIFRDQGESGWQASSSGQLLRFLCEGNPRIVLVLMGNPTKVIVKYQCYKFLFSLNMEHGDNFLSYYGIDLSNFKVNWKKEGF